MTYADQTAGENLLADETSPYLRQHKDNPVHWRPWSAAALAEAKALDRPVLLSVGYAACHWCHVMAHESFEDSEVADVMNRLFVNIKVDREERPDIDQIYMAALTAMGEQGGWPLTMVLTPEGRPVWGGTYFPRQPRYGRPGFIQVLEAVHGAWREKRDEIGNSAVALTEHLRERLAPLRQSVPLDEQRLPDIARAIHSSIDVQKGGMRGAPKFPNAPFMEALWLDWLRHGTESHRDGVVTSLRFMLAGGIYDHIGGGLCRYSTDDQWLVPHFEKMLYDNAHLIDLATAVCTETGDDLFRYRIEETVGWLKREMTLPGGGFASSLDADTEGEEGLFYLWTEEEIHGALGKEDTGRFLGIYQLASPHGWEGKPVLHRSSASEHCEADTDADFAPLKEALLRHRDTRVRPGRDDKVLVDWNGRAIAAIARASRVFSRPDWLAIARNAFRFVSESEVDGRLPHSVLGDGRLFPCMASDYAAMIEAAVALAEATGDEAFISRAHGWLDMLDRWHGDEDGSYYLTASDADDVPIRIRGDIDDAVPSATSQLIRAILRLSVYTSDDWLYQRCMKMAEAALGRIEDQRYGQIGIIVASELVRDPEKLVIVGARDGDLVSAANRYANMSRTDIILPERAAGGTVSLPDGAVFDSSRPAAWLCRAQTCLPPIHDAAELEQAVRRR